MEFFSASEPLVQPNLFCVQLKAFQSRYLTIMATASDLGEGVSVKLNVAEITWMIVEWVLVIHCLVKSIGSSLISG